MSAGLNKSLFSLCVLLPQLDLTHSFGQEFKAGTVFQYKHCLPDGPEINRSHGELVRGPGNHNNGLKGPHPSVRGEWTLKPGLSVKLQQEEKLTSHFISSLVNRSLRSSSGS